MSVLLGFLAASASCAVSTNPTDEMHDAIVRAFVSDMGRLKVAHGSTLVRPNSTVIDRSGAMDEDTTVPIDTVLTALEEADASEPHSSLKVSQTLASDGGLIAAQIQSMEPNGEVEHSIWLFKVAGGCIEGITRY